MQISSETLPNGLNNDTCLGQTQKEEVGSGFVLIQNRHKQWAVCSPSNWAAVDGKEYEGW